MFRNETRDGERRLPREFENKGKVDTNRILYYSSTDVVTRSEFRHLSSSELASDDVILRSRVVLALDASQAQMQRERSVRTGAKRTLVAPMPPRCATLYATIPQCRSQPAATLSV